MVASYPEFYEEVRRKTGQYGQASPDVMAAFQQMHHAGTSPGAISTKTKELIALGIAISVRCDGCIAFHVHDALKAGATREEIAETIGVAILMSGGPAVVYGSQALEAMEQFEAQETVRGNGHK